MGLVLLLLYSWDLEYQEESGLTSTPSSIPPPFSGISSDRLACPILNVLLINLNLSDLNFLDEELYGLNDKPVDAPHNLERVDAGDEAPELEWYPLSKLMSHLAP